MLIVAFATLAVAAVAGIVYLKREQLGWEGIALASLRTIAMGAMVLLVINPGRSERQQGGNPIVLLDASLSMAVPGGPWQAALDTARRLAGAEGTIYRFGGELREYHTGLPDEGNSQITDALRLAVALGGPVYVVTDGELDDAASVDPRLLQQASFVVLPRDTVADVAILDVSVPARISSGDSVPITVTLGVWGVIESELADLEVFADDRRISTREVELPSSPGLARRSVKLPPRSLTSGTTVLSVRVVSRDDMIAGDDTRQRVVYVTEQPAVVALLDPPDWEGRFLVAELSDVARTTVRGYARITPETWIEMDSGLRVSEESVQQIALSAALLLIRGPGDMSSFRHSRQPVWRWPTIVDQPSTGSQRDWYLAGTVQASPLAGRLATVNWDSLPPVHEMAGQPAGPGDWVAISARQGRRGAERPAVVGGDSAGVRSLLTLGTGWWRWRLRGGAAIEAYRSLLSSGVDWLLGSGRSGSNAPLVSSTVVARGEPTVFEWVRDSTPDSLEVTLLRDSDDSTVTYLARFDSRNTASVKLSPGTYRWFSPDAEGSRGVTVVEQYSDEYHPRVVADLVGGGSGGEMLLERFARDNWWLFVIVVAALSAEWAWRHQRGLP